MNFGKIISSKKMDVFLFCRVYKSRDEEFDPEFAEAKSASESWGTEEPAEGEGVPARNKQGTSSLQEMSFRIRPWVMHY